MEIGVMGGVKFAWYLINGTVSFYWLSNRLLLNGFLVGEWGGDLDHIDDCGNHYNDYLTTCTLMVAPAKNKDNSAYIHYERRCLKDKNSKIANGFDRLSNYKCDTMFFMKRVWTPRFKRVYHEENNEYNSEEIVYNFNCKVPSFFNLIYKQQLDVEVNIGNNRYLSGTLTKR